MNWTITDRIVVAAANGPVGRQELLAQLSVSPTTLKRAIAAAGDRLLRVGAARSTRYYATRTIDRLGSSLPVHRITDTGQVESLGVMRLLARSRQSYGDTVFQGLPPFAVQLLPRGYLGRSFARRHPELGLNDRTQDWSADEQLIALARRGEDGSGNMIIGDESLSRFLAQRPHAVSRTGFPQLARESSLLGAGSSAAGEAPKFTAFVDGRHVIVKFATADAGEAAQRARDLLLCEHLALEAVAAAGVAAARSQVHDVDGWRFLEVERFDRVGERGRLALHSLEVVDNEYLGTSLRSWTETAARLGELGVAAEDTRRIRWLDAFGELIANNDRHAGNLSLLGEHGAYVLAPVYDMLPMYFAPVGTVLVERTFTPTPPTAQLLDVWHDAAGHAVTYWERVSKQNVVSPALRALAERARESIAALSASVPRQVS